MEDDGVFADEFDDDFDYAEPDPECETCSGEGGDPYSYIGPDPEQPLWAYPPCDECGGTAPHF